MRDVDRDTVDRAPKDAPEDSGFSLFGCAPAAHPVLISVPHAGRNYPVELIDNLRVPAGDLLRLEDRYADLLAMAARKAGFGVIMAHKARAWMDLNRAETDLDTEMLSDIPPGLQFTASLKQRGGLGLVPRRLSGVGAIWKRPFTFASVRQRIDGYHRPYHTAIEGILADMRNRFGAAILLDLHSMPPISDSARGPAASFVVGDRFGASAAGRFAEMMQAHFETAGYVCGLNHPYPGDHVLKQHGNPVGDIHAVQLEVDRTLYLDADLREPGRGVEGVSMLILEVAEMLADAALGTAELMAAE
ncbi:MAG: N-formylglutamate amidohydrolase [Sphingorhabdus sp.]